MAATLQTDGVITRLLSDDPTNDECVNVVLRYHSANQFTRFCEALRTNVNARKFAFYLGRFVEGGAFPLEPLLIVLRNRANLRDVSLVGSPASPETTICLLDALAMNRSVSILNLQRIVIPVGPLVNFLQNAAATIEQFWITHGSQFRPQDNGSAVAASAAALSTALGECASLTRVHFADWDMAYLAPLVQCLQTHKTLEGMYFIGGPEQTACSIALAQLVASVLEEWTSSQLGVCLTNYRFDKAVFAPIAQAAIKGPTVELDFYGCKFDEAATGLFESMVAPPSELKFLSIGCRGMEFAKPLGNVFESLLSANSSLDSLVVDGFGENEQAAMAAIMKALESNSRLDYLGLTDIRSAASYGALIAGIPKMVALKRLVFRFGVEIAFNENDFILALERNSTIRSLGGRTLRSRLSVDGSAKLELYLSRNRDLATLVQNPSSISISAWCSIFQRVQVCYHGPSLMYQVLKDLEAGAVGNYRRRRGNRKRKQTDFYSP